MKPILLLDHNDMVHQKCPTQRAAFTRFVIRHSSFVISLRAASKAAAKAALFLLSIAILLAGGAATVHGQSALDGFNPNANGAIYAAVVQPDGKILLAGGFTNIAGQPRNYLVRLNPDGTLDTAFNPNANAGPIPIAVQADGKILVGGSFTSIGGQPRNYIARLDPTTGLADSFNPNANNPLVDTIVVQPDGKILVGGLFTNVGGQTRNHIARLDPTTGLADSFDPNANDRVFSIVLQADGKILAGGDFNGANSIGGQPRNYIARLDPTTGLADSFDPNASNRVGSIAVQADGKILAGGVFTTIGGQGRNHIGRLDATAGLADSFNPNANLYVGSIVAQADGKILVGGSFSGANSIGGQTRNYIARLDATTGSADSFDPNANSGVAAIAVQADGKILVGGQFSGANSIGGQTRNNIARLETNGRADQTLNLNIVGRPVGSGGSGPLASNPFVFVTAVQPDGKILIGGKFTSVLGVARHNIARLNTDNEVDTTFDPNANNPVSSIAVQANGKILAGGEFTNIGGQTRNFIARLDSTGLADSFDPNANGDVDTIATQPDGRILVGGQFNGPNGIGGQTRNFIARLDPMTGLADSFNPNANGRVHSLAVQADGKILAGGLFSGANSIGGQTRNFIARLDGTSGMADLFDPNANNEIDTIATQPDGRVLVGGNFSGANSIGGQTRNYIARLDGTSGMADSFDPDANSAVHTIVVQADGQVLAGGLFTSIHGQTRNYIARLDATTGLANSFDPNADGEVDSITTQPDGKILVGGQFNSIGGEARHLFARLTNDNGALQDLAVTRPTVTWNRDGSSPQLARVTFEFSTDNVNYTPLGNGTAMGSNWVLTGLNLPIEQNIYIRARGYYGGGFHNASESITESVREAFITLSIAGSISYCSNPSLNPVPGVTLTLSGDRSASTLSNGLGNYKLLPVPSGGNYTVTPTRAALAPGSAGINTVDVIAVQRHLLNLGTPLSGCRLTAADVNGDTAVNTVDVIAIQRFLLNLTTGLANVGKYQFSPAIRTYSGMVGDQTGQNYNALVFGDVTTTFVHRPEDDPAQDEAEVAATVATVALPEVAIDQSKSRFVAYVFSANGAASLSARRGENSPQISSAESAIHPNDCTFNGVLNRAFSAGDDPIKPWGDAPGSNERTPLALNSNFAAPVSTTTIDAKNKLVGFQGDFTFDERVVTFQSEPVHKAGITGGNWNVSGNVLPGPGPIRTLRISAYSNDFTPLSGSGTLFELRMRTVSDSALPFGFPSGPEPVERPHSAFPLLWAAPPDHFIFIDADLNTQKPGNTAPGSVTSSKRR